jgi:hypothetical protein
LKPISWVGFILPDIVCRLCLIRKFTGWDYASDILKVSGKGTGVVATAPADLAYNLSFSGLGNTLTMGHVNFDRILPCWE